MINRNQTSSSVGDAFVSTNSIQIESTELNQFTHEGKTSIKPHEVKMCREANQVHCGNSRHWLQGLRRSMVSDSIDRQRDVIYDSVVPATINVAKATNAYIFDEDDASKER